MSNAIPTRRYAKRTLSLAMAGSAGLLAVVCSCTSSGEPAREPRLVNTGPPALHALDSKELTKAMRDLDREASSPEGASAGSITGRPSSLDFDSVIKASLAIARTADSLPDLVKNTSMSDEERHVFAGLSAKLRDQATDLNQEATRKNLYNTRESMRRVDAICNACHATFRLMPLK